MTYFLVFEVFISAECVYRMYLTYLLLNLSNKRILSFFIFWDFLAIFQISWNFVILQPKKMSPISKNLTVDMDFSSKRKFFALFLGINSDKIHYNSISSKQAVIFCSIKSSVIQILTGHKTYNMKIHKILKNGPKNKIYSIIRKRRSCRIQIYP